MGGAPQAIDHLNADPPGRDHQQQPIGKSAEGFGPDQPERALLGPGLGGESGSTEGEDEAGHIAEHVHGIGEQGQ